MPAQTGLRNRSRPGAGCSRQGLAEPSSKPDVRIVLGLAETSVNDSAEEE